ncbi:ABC transporter [Erysipelothrix larvae]|uniref:ABC transporter n=1 Tax=Erysipelothrix larvae TaxID=1514105 RepID=A0A0X8GYN9_9FIRM|nr:ABC transporter ATP-binding protein [Erysipelothrix larvae]AMC92841.1 ABC transporter [Erysipelothrix larvae]
MTKRTLKNLSRYLMHSKWWFIFALSLTLIGDVLSLLGPKLIGLSIDTMRNPHGGVDFDQLYTYVGLMVFIYCVSFIASYVSQNILLRISQKVAYSMRKDVFSHLEKMRIHYFDTHQTGDIISRISYDIDTINTSLSSDLVTILSGSVTVVVSVGMMVAISMPLSLIPFGTIIFMSFFARYRMKKVKPLFTKRSIQLGQLNGYAEDILRGHKTIKSYGQEAYFFKTFSNHNEVAGEAYYQADYQGSIMGPTVSFVNNISLSLISAFGALLYLRNALTIGNISSFVLYSRRFSGPLNEISSLVSELQSAMSAAERIFALLDEPEEIIDSDTAVHLPKDVPLGVHFDHVNFEYVKDRPVLKDLTLDVKPTQQIAIVGPTGSGKTTIINILMRFYEINAGTITINGINTKDIARESLRRSMGIVLQDSWVFCGSIYENLTYGVGDCDMDAVIEACKKSNIHDYIESLPDGYQTWIQDDALIISEGQKQLLSIARVFLSKASILILDEATSNVDTQTELMIQNAMQEVMKGRTCFIIAHRLSTIRNADEILVIQKGEIAETGDHDDLMRQKGAYFSLYASQFETQDRVVIEEKEEDVV